MSKKRKRLIDDLDRLIQIYIVTKCKKMCELCRKRSDTVSGHHLIKRDVFALRWDEQNVMGVCMDCHKQIHDRPEFKNYIWSILQDREDVRHDYLHERKNVIAKPSLDELENKRKHLLKLIEYEKSGFGFGG